MKKLLIFIIIFGFGSIISFTVNAQQNYNFYVVKSFDEGNVDDCSDPEKMCTLNSAVTLSESIPLNSVILVELPYKSIYQNEQTGEKMPFYIVKEFIQGRTIWKITPAPLIARADLKGLEEDITDYFLTWNSGILRENDNTFLGSLFFGQFKKYHESEKNDYDVKIPFFRILDIPKDALEFNSSEELVEFIYESRDNNLYFDKLFLNGFHLRIYEQSFARAVFFIMIIVTVVIVLLNLLIFPNLLLYISLIINKRNKTKVIGLVYDSKTGTPLSFAILRMYRYLDGNKVFIKQTISDLDGNYYGFAVDKGKYILEVIHENYQSKEIIQEIYDDQGLVVDDIGVSQKEKSKVQKNLVQRFKGYALKNVREVNRALVIFNLLIAFLNILLAQNFFNIIILSLAITQFIFYRIIFKKREWGVVLDSRTRSPIKSAFVKVYDSELNQLNVQLTDSQGRFGFVLNKPEYMIYVNAVGYKFPSSRDSNPKHTTQVGETFIKLHAKKNKKISFVILLDRV